MLSIIKNLFEKSIGTNTKDKKEVLAYRENVGLTNLSVKTQNYLADRPSLHVRPNLSQHNFQAIAAHGTGIDTLKSALENTNAQLVPGNALKRNNVEVCNGKVYQGKGFNAKHVSVVKSNDEKLSLRIPYSFASENGVICLGEVISERSIFPNNTPEDAVKRLNIRAVFCDAKKLSEVQDIINSYSYNIAVMPFECLEDVTRSQDYSNKQIFDLAKNLIFPNIENK